MPVLQAQENLAGWVWQRHASEGGRLPPSVQTLTLWSNDSMTTQKLPKRMGAKGKHFVIQGIQITGPPKHLQEERGAHREAEDGRDVRMMGQRHAHTRTHTVGLACYFLQRTPLCTRYPSHLFLQSEQSTRQCETERRNCITPAVLEG